LNRYRIECEIGEGGMGVVYLGHDQVREKAVAIKVLRNILSRDPGSVKRLLVEANLSMELTHPNIVRVHNFESGESLKFIVMEYIVGETLARRLAENGPLDEAEARQIAIEICKGLEHAHEKKIVHRDLKPGNILLGRDGSVKIADFGIARVCRESLSRLTSQGTPGTLAYMSPEQLDGETSERSDLYSVGVILYEMISGNPPFNGEPYVHKIKNVAPKPLEGISPALNEIVLRCLSKNPDTRFASIRNLREELDGTAEKRRSEEARRRLEEEERNRKEAEAARKQADAHEAGLRQREQEEQNERLSALKSRAEQAFNNQQYEEAIRCWEGALSQSPADSAIRGNIAYAKSLLVQKKQETSAQPVPHPARSKNNSAKILAVAAVVIGLVVFGTWIYQQANKESGHRTSTDLQRTAALPAEQPQQTAEPVPPPRSQVEPDRYPKEESNKSSAIAEVTRTRSGMNNLGMEFVSIEPGSFEMGSYSGFDEEKPVHRVTISRRFQMQITEVTQGQWEAVMGSNPSYFKNCGKDCPVEQVSWNDAKVFIVRLNERNDGWLYRLPTEAEWEYAARAGTTGQFAGNLDDMAWYDANSGNTTHPVSQKQANAWGLYDMHGNVWEWVEDWYGHYPSGAATDPKGPSSGSARVCRGGSWFNGAGSCRSELRNISAPDDRGNDLGFRLVRTAR
jgi:formylglycine-generating enzyme required for sulfatase activity